MEAERAREFDKESLEGLLVKVIWRKGFTRAELEGFAAAELFMMKELIEQRIKDLQLTHESRGIGKKIAVVLADGLFNQDFEGDIQARWLSMMIQELDEQIARRGLPVPEEVWG
jgi:hypothetical protein